MTDIVDRLRTVDISWSQEGELCAEAADEIERLRKALKKIAPAITKMSIKLDEMNDIFCEALKEDE